ncbi:MAG: amino acid dehydrogenase [Gammaproteobacteria bacterium]|nr:amino acid dehydrogenase [Gammaproteobacteria bacterium]MBU2676407.1 amino acid dehydrogenase [Gammaproteobacteria bacterium]NNC55958.1 Glu/Leu/Phe/Val dehydrogenase [Woeseiaceae bacterium]NNL50142.1 Glu/Leu/Phe/Val dehydrogenase [Woeseiaceae bacterium]
MGVFDHAEFDNHESLHFFQDDASGLRAIIAVHSTALGPAAGGCRRWIYASDADALTDALRLSRGMTYKNAVAGLKFGGGKAVILGNDQAPKSPQLFAAFGRAVDSLGGRYITAEDVGCTVEDMRYVREQTEFVSGLPQNGSSAGGDPSPWTAIGCFQGIQAAVESRLGTDSFKGLRVAVQGVGHVGLHLCRLLHEAGAELFVSDVNPENLALAKSELPVTEVAPSELIYADVDVLSPCALGNILTSSTIPRIQAKVIAGAANNQLSTVADGARLAARDILYAPDYVINAGGIISVAREYYGSSSEDEVRADVCRIRDRLQAIFDEAKTSGRPTNELADELARNLVAAAK